VSQSATLVPFWNFSKPTLNPAKYLNHDSVLPDDHHGWSCQIMIRGLADHNFLVFVLPAQRKFHSFICDHPRKSAAKGFDFLFRRFWQSWQSWQFWQFAILTEP
jgi:hypothetical protein